MTLHFSTRYILIASALTLTVAAALTLTPIASAQATNQTATPEPAAGNVGPIEIEKYELKDGTMTLTLDVSRPTAYALSDALAGTQSEGVTEIPVKQGTLSAGRQTLKMDVSIVRDAGAVTLSTPRNAVRIQSGNVLGEDSSLQASRVRVLVVGTAIGAGLVVFRTVRNKRDEDTEDWERII